MITFELNSDDVYIRDFKEDRKEQSIVTNKLNMTLFNQSKSKCLRVELSEPIVLQCGINVSAEAPGSETGEKGNTPCGPNMSEVKEFRFANDSPVKDLHLTYIFTGKNVVIKEVVIHWTHAVGLFQIECYNDIDNNW